MRINPIQAVLVALIVANGAVAGLASQRPASAEQVLDRYVEATGGRAAYAKLTSLVMKGSVELVAQGITGTVETWAKAPHKKLEVVSLPGIGVQKNGYDGAAGWSSDAFNGTRTLAGPELGALRRSARFNGEANWRDAWRSAELVGTEKVGDREAYVVRLTPKEGEGAVVTNYYDAETFLLVRTTTTLESPQGTMPVATSLSDYRDVAGVKVPFALDQVVSGMTIRVRFAEVKANAEVDDALFAKP